MILGNGNTPFVPVVTPNSYHQSESVEPLFGATDDDLLQKRDDLFEDMRFNNLVAKKEEELSLAAKKRFLLFGLAGVAIGAAVTGSMTAFALRSYRRTDSVVLPAIYAGLGSAAMGTAMVLILSRAVAGEKVDSRVAALAVGARLAS